MIDPTEMLLHARMLHETVRQAAMTHTRDMACDNIDGDRIRDCRKLGARDRIRVVSFGLARLLAVLLPRWPRVSVITPTWQRRDLLLKRCVPSVEDQDYQGVVEHVIVSDGPDPTLPPMAGLTMLTEHRALVNRGVLARWHGTQLANGDVLAYLDDDNAWRPRHLGTLVRALVDSGADFAYSRALCHSDRFSYSVGLSPPAFAQIDTSLIVHRRELLDVANWRPSVGPSDWDLVRRWTEAGAKWAFVPEITLDYYHRGVT